MHVSNSARESWISLYSRLYIVQLHIPQTYNVWFIWNKPEVEMQTAALNQSTDWSVHLFDYS